jgi:hypothetical protein
MGAFLYFAKQRNEDTQTMPLRQAVGGAENDSPYASKGLPQFEVGWN